VRHHPAFKYYSQKLYGDPEALDRKIMTKLVAEIARAFRTIFSQKLLANYQEANYYDMILTGVLAGDRTLVDFAAPNQELTLYNHHYQDGLNGGGRGQLHADAEQLTTYPSCATEKAAGSNSTRTSSRPPVHRDRQRRTEQAADRARLGSFEFADEHMYAFNHAFLDRPGCGRGP